MSAKKTVDPIARVDRAIEQAEELINRLREVREVLVDAKAAGEKAAEK